MTMIATGRVGPWPDTVPGLPIAPVLLALCLPVPYRPEAASLPVCQCSARVQADLAEW